MDREPGELGAGGAGTHPVPVWGLGGEGSAGNDLDA